ncbi:MAG: CvpA family protein [Paludibacter sp.]|nr:CvpA family protein [Paludibacter sp.]
MNTLDSILILFLLIGFIIGLIRGFVRETISILIVIVAIYFSKWLTPIAQSMLEGVFSFPSSIAKPLSFVIVFVSILILFNILAKALTRLAEAASLGGLNRILGGFLGGLKHALIASFVLNMIVSSSFFSSIIERKSIKESKLYAAVQPLTPVLWAELEHKLNKD